MTEAGAGDLEDRTRLAALVAEADHLIARGQFAEVLDIVQRMLDLATRCGDDAFEALAHFWFGFIYHLLGDPIRQMAISSGSWPDTRRAGGPSSGRWSVSTSCRTCSRFQPSTSFPWGTLTRHWRAAPGR